MSRPSAPSAPRISIVLPNGGAVGLDGAWKRGRADVRQRPDRLRVLHALGEDVVRAVPEQLGCDPRAQEGDEDQEDDEDAAGDRELVALEADPDELPVAPSLDRSLSGGCLQRDRPASCAGARELRLEVDRPHRRGSIADGSRMVTRW